MSYTKKYAQHYLRGFSMEKELIAIRREVILKALKKYKPKRVLEIGCGLEPLFLHYKSFKQFTVVEPSKMFVNRARRHAKQHRPIDIIQGRFEHIYKQLESSQFDFIVLSSLLHEVPEPNKLLRLIQKVCRKNTVIHINVPNVYSFHRLLAYEMGLIKNIFTKSKTEKQFNRQTRFDKEKLLKMIKKNKFKVLRCGTYFIKPLAHEQMEGIIKEKIAKKNIILGLQKMIKYMPDLGCELFVEAKLKSSTR